MGQPEVTEAAIRHAVNGTVYSWRGTDYQDRNRDRKELAEIIVAAVSAERAAPTPSRDDIARSIALVDGLVSPPMSGKYGRYADAVIDMLRADREEATPDDRLTDDRRMALIDSLSYVDEATDPRMIAVRVIACLQGRDDWESVEVDG